jgi:hypothetical protein
MNLGCRTNIYFTDKVTCNSRPFWYTGLKQNVIINNIYDIMNKTNDTLNTPLNSSLIINQTPLLITKDSLQYFSEKDLYLYYDLLLINFSHLFDLRDFNVLWNIYSIRIYEVSYEFNIRNNGIIILDNLSKAMIENRYRHMHPREGRNILSYSLEILE